MTTKGEKRERIRRNRRKMEVHGRSIFNLLRIMGTKAVAAKQTYDKLTRKTDQRRG